MPSNLHLLVVILAGYLFIHVCNYFHYRAKALEGHRLVVEASIAGLAAFLVARPLMLGVKALDTCLFDSFLQRLWFWLLGGTPYSGTLLAAAILAPAAAYAINLWEGYRHRDELSDWKELGWRKNYQEISKTIALRKAIERTGNDLLILLHEAATRWPDLLGVTMGDRKMYVGWAARSPRLAETESHFAMFPLMSGYRDKDTLRPRFDFFYPIDSSGFQGIQDDRYRFLVVLPFEEVRSARLLDKNFDPKELSGEEPEAEAQKSLELADPHS